MSLNYLKNSNWSIDRAFSTATIRKRIKDTRTKCDFNIIKSILVVDLLFNVLPIVCGSSVFAFVWLCIALCPFYFCNHLGEEEKDGCLATIVL